MEDKKQQLIEIWGDVVDLRDLVQSILISGITTMGAFFLAPGDNPTKQLFFGLIGALIGFILSVLLTKPKRQVFYSEDTDKKNNKGEF